MITDAIHQYRKTFWELNRQSVSQGASVGGLIRNLHAQGRFEDAEALLNDKLSLPPDCDRWLLHNALALTHLGLGSERLALEELDRAEACIPPDADVGRALCDIYINRSAVYKALLDYPAACEWASRAIDQNPKQCLARLALIGIHAAYGNVESARDAFERMDRECTGWHDVSIVWHYLDNDSDFAALREDPDFQGWFALRPAGCGSGIDRV